MSTPQTSPEHSNVVYERKFSISEAAELLGIAPISLRRRVSDGAIGSYRCGGRILIGEKHLREYLARVEQPVKAA
jgi:excisionase family DNA binding protein